MTEIRLYNTKTRTVEPLEPTVRPGKVGLYVCGPTVYDRAHLGNARPVVVFDVLFRLLRHLYGPQNVTYVRNFTDVDDKIIARAAETGRPIGQITEETTRWYLEDMAALGALEPTEMPRATAYIPEMVAMIERLIAKGHAYTAERHVLFDVRSYAEYGHLSGRSVDDMIAGARVEVAPYKRDPMDFVLWKPSTPDLPGWDSPWGRGRPGWHIECSAMSLALLGESFDIHGGGIDLQFPHHENEIAQSRCAHPEGAFARIWMHNEMLQVEGKKMSKSLGNFFSVRDLLDEYRDEFDFQNFGPAIRYRLLMAHYRSPIDAAKGYLEQAATKLDVYQHLLKGWDKPSAEKDYQAAVRASGIVDALSDDLNTPLALAMLDRQVSEIRMQTVPPLPSGASIPMMPSTWIDFPTARDRLGCGLDFLGFSMEALRDFDSNARAERRRKRVLLTSVADRIEALLAARAAARQRREFVHADVIRDGLAAAGVTVMDRPGARTEWEIGADFDPSKLEALK